MKPKISNINTSLTELSNNSVRRIKTTQTLKKFGCQIKKNEIKCTSNA